MSNKKLRIANTETDNLVSNLRGEIAEVVTSWILMQRFMGGWPILNERRLRVRVGFEERPTTNDERPK